MMTGLEQQLEPGKKCIHEVDQIAVALGTVLQVSGREDRADRNGVDRPLSWHQDRVVLGAEAGRHVRSRDRRIERNGKEVEALIGGNAKKERRRLAGNEGKCGDFTLAQLPECNFLIVVGGRYPNIQKVEQSTGGNRSTGSAQIDIDPLVRQICHALDFPPSQEVKLLVVQLSKVTYPRLDAGEVVRLLRMIEDIRLQDSEVDASQKFEISDVLQRSLTDNGQN